MIFSNDVGYGYISCTDKNLFCLKSRDGDGCHNVFDVAAEFEKFCRDLGDDARTVLAYDGNYGSHKPSGIDFPNDYITRACRAQEKESITAP